MVFIDFDTNLIDHPKLSEEIGNALRNFHKSVFILNLLELLRFTIYGRILEFEITGTVCAYWNRNLQHRSLCHYDILRLRPRPHNNYVFDSFVDLLLSQLLHRSQWYIILSIQKDLTLIHTCTPIHIHTHHVYTFACMYPHTWTHIHKHVRTSTQIYMHTCIHIYIHAHRYSHAKLHIHSTCIRMHGCALCTQGQKHSHGHICLRNTQTCTQMHMHKSSYTYTHIYAHRCKYTHIHAHACIHIMDTYIEA